MTHEEKLMLLIDGKYPLSAKYDPEWIYENRMGCQCLWLVESLSRLISTHNQAMGQGDGQA